MATSSMRLLKSLKKPLLIALPDGGYRGWTGRVISGGSGLAADRMLMEGGVAPAPVAGSRNRRGPSVPFSDHCFDRSSADADIRFTSRRYSGGVRSSIEANRARSFSVWCSSG